jgi:hypothetical protein
MINSRRGSTTEALVTDGADRFCARASRRHKLSVPFPETGWPLTMRVARHLAGIVEFSRSLGEMERDKS